MSVLVLHYDQNVASVCEATGLISAIPRLSHILAGANVSGGLSGGSESSGSAPPLPGPRCLPRSNMTVLVSPSYWRQRKAFYGDYCVVKPLLFRWVGSPSLDPLNT